MRGFLGGLLILVGLVGLVIALIAVIRGGLGWARIPSRKVAAVAAVAAFAVMGVGAGVSPKSAPSTNTADPLPTTTSSSSPDVTTSDTRSSAPTTVPTSVATTEPTTTAPTTTTTTPAATTTTPESSVAPSTQPPRTQPAVDPRVVTKSLLGKAWPLNVDHGLLNCYGSAGVGSATFIAPDGTEYALNGIAKAKYPAIDPIWSAGQSPGTKKDIGPLIERALKLCE